MMYILSIKGSDSANNVSRVFNEGILLRSMGGIEELLERIYYTHYAQYQTPITMWELRFWGVTYSDEGGWDQSDGAENAYQLVRNFHTIVDGRWDVVPLVDDMSCFNAGSYPTLAQALEHIGVRFEARPKCMQTIWEQERGFATPKFTAPEPDPMYEDDPAEDYADSFFEDPKWDDWEDGVDYVGNEDCDDDVEYENQAELNREIAEEACPPTKEHYDQLLTELMHEVRAAQKEDQDAELDELNQMLDEVLAESEQCGMPKTGEELDRGFLKHLWEQFRKSRQSK